MFNIAYYVPKTGHTVRLESQVSLKFASVKLGGPVINISTPLPYGVQFSCPLIVMLKML